MVEWFSGGREAAAEVRQGGGRGGFPCLLNASALGERHKVGSCYLGLSCLPSPRKEDSDPHWAGGESRGLHCSNFAVGPEGGKCWA